MADSMRAPDPQGRDTMPKKEHDKVTGKFFERLYFSSVVQRDPLVDVVLIPPKDVSVSLQPRQFRTIGPSVPVITPSLQNNAFLTAS